MARLARTVVVACGLLALTACAEGGSIDGEGGAGGGAGLGGSDGTTNAASTTGASVSASSTGVGAGDEGGAMGTGGEPPLGGSGEGGGGPLCNFTAVEDCATAEPLPAIGGDEDDPPVIRMGDSSKWFKIHIEEQVSGISGEDLSYTVSLTSPPGMNYDLRVRQGAQNGSPECNATIKNGAGTPESVSDAWDDDQGFGGEDDSVWLVIEVVHVSGDDCGTGAQWTLQVQGHT